MNEVKKKLFEHVTYSSDSDEDTSTTAASSSILLEANKGSKHSGGKSLTTVDDEQASGSKVNRTKKNSILACGTSTIGTSQKIVVCKKKAQPKVVKKRKSKKFHLQVNFSSASSDTSDKEEGKHGMSDSSSVMSSFGTEKSAEQEEMSLTSGAYVPESQRESLCSSNSNDSTEYRGMVPDSQPTEGLQGHLNVHASRRKRESRLLSSSWNFPVYNIDCIPESQSVAFDTSTSIRSQSSRTSGSCDRLVTAKDKLRRKNGASGKGKNYLRNSNLIEAVEFSSEDDLSNTDVSGTGAARFSTPAKPTSLGVLELSARFSQILLSASAKRKPPRPALHAKNESTIDYSDSALSETASSCSTMLNSNKMGVSTSSTTLPSVTELSCRFNSILSTKSKQRGCKKQTRTSRLQTNDNSSASEASMFGSKNNLASMKSKVTKSAGVKKQMKQKPTVQSLSSSTDLNSSVPGSIKNSSGEQSYEVQSQAIQVSMESLGSLSLLPESLATSSVSVKSQSDDLVDSFDSANVSAREVSLQVSFSSSGSCSQDNGNGHETETSSPQIESESGSNSNSNSEVENVSIKNVSIQASLDSCTDGSLCVSTFDSAAETPGEQQLSSASHQKIAGSVKCKAELDNHTSNTASQMESYDLVKHFTNNAAVSAGESLHLQMGCDSSSSEEQIMNFTTPEQSQSFIEKPSPIVADTSHTNDAQNSSEIIIIPVQVDENMMGDQGETPELTSDQSDVQSESPIPDTLQCDAETSSEIVIIPVEVDDVAAAADQEEVQELGSDLSDVVPDVLQRPPVKDASHSDGENTSEIIIIPVQVGDEAGADSGDLRESGSDLSDTVLDDDLGPLPFEKTSNDQSNKKEKEMVYRRVSVYYSAESDEEDLVDIDSRKKKKKKRACEDKTNILAEKTNQPDKWKNIDSDSEGSDLENFFQKMRTPAKKRDEKKEKSTD